MIFSIGLADARCERIASGIPYSNQKPRTGFKVGMAEDHCGITVL